MKYPYVLLLLLPMTCLAAAPAPEAAPQATTPAAAIPPSPGEINCHYVFPTTTNTIDPSHIETWVTQAALQAFQFNPSTIDTQLLAIKPCFTEQGWQGFNDALKKSGNLDAIKSKQLVVSSQLNGKASLETTKDGQWKSTVPVQVTYQNKTQKISQSLTIDLIIYQKTDGTLGIMQLIAMPVKVTDPTLKKQ
jgi:hypothetical protein